MNVRNLSLAGILLAASSIPTTVSAYEDRNQQVIERTTYTTSQNSWIAEHNYKHRLRLGRVNPSTEFEVRQREIDASVTTRQYRE